MIFSTSLKNNLTLQIEPIIIFEQIIFDPEYFNQNFHTRDIPSLSLSLSQYLKARDLKKKTSEIIYRILSSSQLD